MLVDLDIYELGFLLERCIHGSHLRSNTIARFTDEFFDKLSEDERMRIFEWTVRLEYGWGNNPKHFEPSSACCGEDIIFMKRYHPENQYMVTARRRFKGDDGKWHQETKKVRAFRMDGRYYVGSKTYVDETFIMKVEHLDLSKKME